MKLKNTRIVGTSVVPACSGHHMLMQYERKRAEINEAQKESGGSLWMNLRSSHVVPQEIISALITGNEQPAFKACFVGYDYPVHPKTGLDRRHALRMLRKMGLVAPSTVQTILLACLTILTGEVRMISAGNGDRRVMATVPVNPEMPYFYYFGLGFDSKGDFQKHPYNLDGAGGFESTDGDGNLYFWHDAKRLPQYNFPLLLGIEPS